jgi:HEAT repeat protein
MTEGTLDSLIAQLASPDKQVRRAAAQALGERRDPRALEALLPLARDPRWEVQGAVARALGLLGDLRALPTLIDLFEARTYPLIESDGAPHRFAEIVEGAAIGLAHLYRRTGDETPFELLAKCFERRGNGDAISAACTALGLGHTGDFRATPLLLGALDTEKGWVRYRAIVALGILGDPAALPALFALMQPPHAPSLTWPVADALARFAMPDCEAPLIAALARLESEIPTHNPDYAAWDRSCVAVVRALGKVDTPGSRRALNERFASAETQSRLLGAIGLAYTGQKRPLYALVDGLASGSLWRQIGVAQALGEIATREVLLPIAQRLGSSSDPELTEALRGALRRAQG